MNVLRVKPKLVMGVSADRNLGNETYNELRMWVAIDFEETDATEDISRLEYWRLAAWVSSGKEGSGERYDRRWGGGGALTYIVNTGMCHNDDSFS